MGKIVLLFMIIAGMGGYIALSAYKDDERFFSTPYQQGWVKSLGRKGARIFNFIFGSCVTIFALFMIVRIVSDFK